MKSLFSALFVFVLLAMGLSASTTAQTNDDPIVIMIPPAVAADDPIVIMIPPARFSSPWPECYPCPAKHAQTAAAVATADSPIPSCGPSSCPDLKLADDPIVIMIPPVARVGKRVDADLPVPTCDLCPKLAG